MLRLKTYPSSPFYALENIRGLTLKLSSLVYFRRNYVSNYGNQDVVQQVNAHLLYQPVCKSMLVPISSTGHTYKTFSLYFCDLPGTIPYHAGTTAINVFRLRLSHCRGFFCSLRHN